MGKPKVIIFNSISLDGRMDGGTDEVDMGLYYELAARWNADAMLSGSNTMLQAFAGQPAESEILESDSNPEATPGSSKELRPLAVPYLVVVDSRGRIPTWRAIRSQPFWGEVIVLCSQTTPAAYIHTLTRDNIPFIVAGNDRVDLAQALEELNARFNIQTVRVDSGGILNGALLRAGLVDEVSVLLAPTLIGGESPRSLFVAPDISSSEQIIHMRLLHSEPVRENILWLRYTVQR
jgi:2,5-diamino-6-(ribosylamino)-4(3H)-pyrimidinone 5'-phosphate reductase